MNQFDPVTLEQVCWLLLIGPFVFIPATIVSCRIFIYFYRYCQLKQVKKDVRDLGLAPVTELGLMLNNDYEKLGKIRKIQRLELKAKRSRLMNSDSKLTEDDASQPAETHHYKSFLDRLSPCSIRHFFSATRWGRLWMIFQVLCTALAIMNYILLTYSIGNADKNLIKQIDVVLAGIFALDYALSLYIAEDRLGFYFNPHSLIDLLSIVPPLIYFIAGDTNTFVWFLGLLRILRASRILRTYRLISFSETEERRELIILALTFLNFVFLSASMINALENLQLLEYNTHPTLKNWHDSLYYIMVTFSTIGFGDLTPTSVPSRMLVVILIVLVLIYVPLQTTRIIEIYHSTNVYQRARYKAHSDYSHIIVSGVINHIALLEFCREYFANDPTGHIVILSLEPPTTEIRKLIRHPFYSHRVHFLCGSPLNMSDLKRCSATDATGVFLLNNDTHESPGSNEDEQLRVNRGADADILMQSLILKSAFPGIAVFTQVQDIRSQDLSKHCGSDRTVCIDEIKMSLLARNCTVPGILTLIFNLVHTYAEDENFQMTEAWKTEYHEGAANQLFSLKPPKAFLGKSYWKIVQVIYKIFACTIVGIKRKGHGIIINPPRNFIVREEDVLFYIGTGNDDLSLHISLYFVDTKALNILEGKVEFVTDLTCERPLDEEKTIHCPISSSDSTISFEQPRPVEFRNHIILCGNVGARGIRHFVQTIRAKETNEIIPIVCMLQEVPNVRHSIWADIMGHTNVYVTKGTPLKTANLVSAGIATCRRIVIFTSNTESSSVTAAPSIPDANAIFIIQMIKENWPQTNFIVELVNGANAKYLSARDQQFNLANIQMEAILNNDSLGISDRIELYKKVNRPNSTLKSNFLKQTVEFMGFSDKKAKRPERTTTHESFASGSERRHKHSDYADGPMTNVCLSQLENEAEINESGLSHFPAYHFDRHFAAGMVSVSSFIHSLLCEAYFRPYVIQMVKLLLYHVRNLPVPKECRGKPYSELMKYFIARNMVPLGIYRNAIENLDEHRKSCCNGKLCLSLETNQLPYVYTNCKANDLVFACDLVFVLHDRSEYLGQ